jgi:heme-degrading monooxygenase HmoA
LFKRAPGFIALHLLKCEDNPSCDLTIDCWNSVTAFDNFKRNFATEYQTLDAQLDGLATSETRLGAFTTSPG